MDYSSWCLRALPDKRLVKRGKRVKGAKELKQEFDIALLLCAWERFSEPVVILKGKFPDILWELQDHLRSTNVKHFPSEQIT